MKRRGLSTIVGATFFVIVMASTIGYVTYSMDLVDNLAYQVDALQDRNLNRQSEKFVISNISVDNNEFNLTVTNTGSLPINITKMWAKKPYRFYLEPNKLYNKSINFTGWINY